MNYAKILEDLKNRASRTSFENEKEICLQKIQKIISSGKVKQLSKSSSLKTTFTPIKVLRDIFTEQLFPLYYYELTEGYVPFNFSYSDYRYINEFISKKSGEISSMLGGSVSDKYLKFLKDIKDWAFSQKNILCSYTYEIKKHYVFA